MRVFITGGTGFVGGYVLEELERQGHEVLALVRLGSENKLPKDFKGEIIFGDVFSSNMPPGCDAVIHLIGILRQFRRKGITFEKLHYRATKTVVDAALDSGVNRFILMSANGAKPDGTPYQWTKYLAEEYVRSKVFDWTIFRPSIIFGDPDYPWRVEDKAAILESISSKPEFCTMLLKQTIKPPIPAPMFHPGLNLRQAGEFKLQPVHVRDVAQGIVKSLTNRKSIGKVYHIGGPDEFTWREIVDIIATSVGKKKWKIPTPAWGTKLFAFLFGWLPEFPITKDQITMLMEGNICNSNGFYCDFGIEPIPFRVENLSYLRKRME